MLTSDTERQGMLLSRVAQACFWLARYRERAEFTARVLDVQLLTLLDTHSGDESTDWLPLMKINGSLEHFQKQEKPLNKETALYTLCLDTANQNSILACIRLARENSRQAREQITSEMWEQFNTLYHDLSGLTVGDLIADTHPALQKVKDSALLLQGMADQMMMHGEAWHFIRLGRFIERANTTCRLLAVRSDSELNNDELFRQAVYWIAVLKSVSSLEAFHKTYAAPVSAYAALEFLLLNRQSPRSTLYCLEHAQESLNYISGSTGRRFNNEADRILGQMTARLNYLRLDDIDLLAFLEELQTCMHEVSDLIMRTYCSYEVA